MTAAWQKRTWGYWLTDEYEAAVYSDGQGEWLLAYIKNSMASKTREVVVPLYVA